jgi:23S rRNA (uracil1939-C5)-methyltransferase
VARRIPDRSPRPARAISHEALVTGLDDDGDGVFTVGRRSRTVAGVLPGERVLVRLPANDDLPAELVEVIAASRHRVTPRCRHAGECGGCSWQHIAYGEQLQLKRDLVQRLLDGALGRGRYPVAPVVPTPAHRDAEAFDPATPWGFRHKVHFAFGPGTRGAVVMGHLRRGSREVAGVSECPVHRGEGNALAFAVRAAVERSGVPCGPPPRGVVRHVVVRASLSSRELLGTLVVTTPDRRLKRVTADVLGSAVPPTGWHLNVHPRPGAFLLGEETRRLAGRERVREDVAGVTFLVSPTSFFQTNVRVASLLAEHVLGAVGSDHRAVLDLYAGLGLFSLPLAIRNHRVTAIEENPAAVRDGELSARVNRIPATACRFVRASVEEGLDRVTRGGASYDAVVLDPPRAGASRQVLRRLCDDVLPARIVYVSCDPAALARDLRVLAGGSAGTARYATAGVTPFDMFPHTAHVETVVTLDRVHPR